MAREEPLFGIGIGRFRAESARLASPQLRRYYSAQNAHNQVLQLLGELGVPGAALFLAVLAFSLAPGWRGPNPTLSVTPRGAVVFGILGWSLASLLMHPLLNAEVSAAFWLALGLARAAVAPAQPHSRIRLVAAIPAIVAIVMVVTLPGRVAASRRTINLDGFGIGVSRWQRDARVDIRYRTAGASSAIYVDGRPGRLRLPLRVTRAGRVTTHVDLWLDGRPAGRLALPSDVWTDVSMLLPTPSIDSPRFRRLDFRWTGRAAAQLHIGRERYFYDAGQAAPQ